MKLWHFLLICALIYTGALNARLGVATIYEPVKGAAVGFDRLAEANQGVQHPAVIRPARQQQPVEFD